MEVEKIINENNKREFGIFQKFILNLYFNLLKYLYIIFIFNKI